MEFGVAHDREKKTIFIGVFQFFMVESTFLGGVCILIPAGLEAVDFLLLFSFLFSLFLGFRA